MARIVILLLIHLTVIFAEKIASDDGELLFVQAIWRHGDRTPEGTLIEDIEEGEDLYPEGYGQLTKLGIQQQYSLGRRLADRYVHDVHLLSKDYKSSDIYVRSSDTERTLMSATANMFGFYKNNKVVKQSNLDDFPSDLTVVPVHTIPLAKDHLTNLYTPCKRREAIEKVLEKTTQFQELKEKSQIFFDELAKHCGEHVHLDNLYRFTDILTIKDKNNRPPSWFDNTVKENLSKTQHEIYKIAFGIGVNSYKGLNFGMEIPKIRGGPMLWALIDRMKEKINCIGFLANASLAAAAENAKKLKECQRISKLKYYAYSMHDTTLKAFAQVLGVHDVDGFSPIENPPYATAVTLELYRRKKDVEEYYIKLLLWRPSSTEEKNASTKKKNASVKEKNASPFEDITNRISNCGDDKGRCGLKQFEKRALIYRPLPNIDELCENTNLPLEPEKPETKPPALLSRQCKTLSKLLGKNKTKKNKKN